MFRYYAAGMPQRMSSDVQRDTGVKDRKLAHFLDAIDGARKKQPHNTSVILQTIQTFPQNIFSSIWRLKGMPNCEFTLLQRT